MSALLALALSASPSVAWQPWDPALFARAQAEHRLVILDLQAVWCHWCHVMEAETYGDPEVARLVGQSFLATRVDQDSNPELAARYANWGWPATIVFAADGTEIVKRRGFISPARMAALLLAIVADPSPGPSVVAEPEPTPGPDQLSAEARDAAQHRLAEAYDAVHGGWGNGHKLVQPEALELAVGRALAGDASARAQVTLTLAGLRRLVDPIWGGLYQYSDKDDWSSPHFERLLTIQADGLRSFALAYAAFQDPRDVEAARAIVRYVDRFLSAPEGGFFTSQDADLSEAVDGHAYARLSETQRVAAGIPRVDTHLYPRDEGLYVAALADFGRLTGDPRAIARAWQGAEVIEAQLNPRSSLLDVTAVAAGWLALYRATAKPEALARARAQVATLTRFRRGDGVGFATALSTGPALGVLAQATRDPDENALVARACNAIAQIGKDQTAQSNAATALRFLTSPQILASPSLPAATLLADAEMSRPPLHVVVVGAREVAPNAALLVEAAAAPTFHLDLEVWDPRSPGGDPPAVPPASTGVAYVCGPTFCSPPARTPEALRASIRQQLSR